MRLAEESPNHRSRLYTQDPRNLFAILCASLMLLVRPPNDRPHSEHGNRRSNKNTEPAGTRRVDRLDIPSRCRPATAASSVPSPSGRPSLTPHSAKEFLAPPLGSSPVHPIVHALPLASVELPFRHVDPPGVPIIISRRPRGLLSRTALRCSHSARL